MIILTRQRMLCRVAFKYFDQDSNGDVTFDEFKRVFSANLGPDSLPFTFDSPWVKLFLGRREGRHVLGYKSVTLLNQVALPYSNISFYQQRVHSTHERPPRRASATSICLL